MSENRAGELLGQLLKRYKLEAGLRRGRVLALWPEIAGEMLARLTEPLKLERSELLVLVENAALAHQLTYQREEFVRRYASRLGEGVVTNVRFVTGRPREDAPGRQDPPSRPEPVALPLELARKLERWKQAVPEELRAAVERAGRAVLTAQASAEGKACPICSRVGDGAPCRFCKPLLEDPLVERAARRLEREPEAEPLEGDLLAAARWLAAERLRTKIEDLAPRAIEEPGLQPLLADLAARFARLPVAGETPEARLERLSPAARSLAARR
ncbi:DciA family protein [Oceanithermus sp.]